MTSSLKYYLLDYYPRIHKFYDSEHCIVFAQTQLALYILFNLNFKMIFLEEFLISIYNLRKINKAVGSIHITIFLVFDVAMKQIVLPVA